MLPTQTVPSVTTSSLPARAWLVVALLCVVGCLNYLDRTMITTMRGSIVSAMPMTDAQFGLLTSVFLWVYGLLSPLAGFLADRFNRSRVIIISLFIWSVVTFLTSQATSFEQLLVTRALMGISEACYMPAAFALIADYHRGPTRSLATGIHIAGVMVGQSLGFVGGVIAEQSGWNAAFSLFGLIGVAYAVVLLFLLRDAPRLTTATASVAATEVAELSRPNVHFTSAVRDLFSRRAFRLALLCWGLTGVVSWMTAGWLPTYYKEQFGLSQSDAGLYATAYFYTATMVGVLLGGAWSDRWSRTNPRARLIIPIIGFCLAVPGVLIASTTSVLLVAVAGFVLYALTRPFIDSNMMPILCLIADPRYRATGYGILNLFSCLVGGAGIYAGGLLRDTNVDLSLLFQAASGLLIICAVALAFVKIRPTTTTEF